MYILCFASLYERERSEARTSLETRRVESNNMQIIYMRMLYCAANDETITCYNTKV